MRPLEAGDEAPDFEATDTDGHLHRLADYRGRFLVLWFYPYDSTRGCDIEACGFRDLRTSPGEGLPANVAVLGIGGGGLARKKAFKEARGLKDPLLLDKGGRIRQAFGARGFLGFTKRITYLIDPGGRVLRVWRHVRPRHHAQEVADAIPRLRGP